MKPPLKAVLLKQEACTQPPRMDEWGILLSEGIPLLLHRSTGLIYGLCVDATEENSVYSVPIGQELDEHANYRKIGAHAIERIGREAITAYLYAVAMYLHDEHRPEIAN